MSPSLGYPQVSSLLQQRSWSRRPILWFALLFVALPMAYIASHVVAASRNIVFWDEFDAALDLLLKIDSGIEIGRAHVLNSSHT